MAGIKVFSNKKKKVSMIINLEKTKSNTTQNITMSYIDAFIIIIFFVFINQSFIQPKHHSNETTNYFNCANAGVLEISKALDFAYRSPWLGLDGLGLEFVLTRSRFSLPRLAIYAKLEKVDSHGPVE